ncbi:MAG: hypothetical protein GYB31_01210 [Bacteroidetes bacterium]|nr:hypothetical protein [Bacteroidota bacterium]
MKQLFLLASFLLAWLTPGQPESSSTESGGENSFVCAFDSYLIRLSEDTEFHSRKQKQDKDWRLHQLSGQAKMPLMDHVLPVVVHIIHDNGPENISDASVIQGIQNLNDAFANVGYYDQGAGVAVPVQFCLAQQDPNGNATTGITRDVSAYTDMNVETDDLVLKNINRWDPTCYINIWLVRSIESGAGNPDVAGYASFPAEHGSSTDGIVMEAEWLGANPAFSVVLVHEMGHYLGLYHTFQGGCVNDDCLVDGDQVCDTPPDQSTAPLPCNISTNTCSTDTDSGLATDQPDMTNNYLDFSLPDCYNAFTNGQRDRMLFFTEGARASLLGCTSCQLPCTDAIAASISASATEVFVSTNVDFVAVTSFADNWEWTVDGTIVSLEEDMSYSFDEEGTFWVTLTVGNSNASCLATDSILINVTCPVVASMTPDNLECLLPGESITFYNQSENANVYQWFVDGTPVAFSEDFTYSFPDEGTYQVQLWASNTLCHSLSSIEIIHVGCEEVCNNGYDDDGDGLVDCYDPDCFCEGECEDYYYNPCFLFCQQSDFDLIEIQGDINWVSDYSMQLAPADLPVAGDLDQDGYPELVIRGDGDDNSRWFVINGKDGSLKFTLENIWEIGQGPSPAIGDVDRDGFGEILIAGRTTSNVSDPGYLHCFEHDGSLKFISPVNMLNQLGGQNSNAQAQLGLSDFNLDSYPEIYVGNDIYSGQDGALLVSGTGISTLSVGSPGDAIAGGEGVCFSVASDVLDDAACIDCAGKEIVAGNQVLSVNVQNGNINIASQLFFLDYPDGFTSIADFDSDGDMDAVVNTIKDDEVFLYAWDLQTPNVLGEISLAGNPHMSFRTSLADFDGDGALEIAITSGESLQIIDQNFTTLWSMPLTDNLFTDPIPTAFDFENDGAWEVVLRDEENIYIFNGQSGAIRWQYAAEGSTGLDYCLILDVDGDGLTEIVTPARIDDGGEIQDVLMAFESSGSPWAATRPVWNQHAFYGLNVEDDLSINPEEQAMPTAGNNEEMNGFLQQVPLRDSRAPDAAWDFATIFCEGDSMRMYLRICNTGHHILSENMEVQLYDSDPTLGPANVITSLAIGENLKSFECVEFNIFIPFTVNQDLFLVLNDDQSLGTPYNLPDDFPMTPIRECDYGNNMITVNFPYTFPALDLGPDTTTCEFIVTNLDAGIGFSSYEWQDGFEGQIYSATNPGTYWVTAQDACGYTDSDTITISLAPEYILELGNDTILCEGEGLSLSANNYDSYFWSPSSGLDCDTCSNVLLNPDSSGTWVLTAITAEGCFYEDSIHVGVGESYLIEDTLQICNGQTIDIFGQQQGTPGIYVQQNTTLTGCDSVLSITLQVSDTIYQSSNLSICAGETVDIFGNAESAAGYYEQGFTTAMGCDSVVGVFLEVLDTLSYSDSVYICAGDTIQFWGQSFWQEGVYSEVFSGSNGCDSTHLRYLGLLQEITTNEQLNVCQGDSVLIFGSFESQPGFYVDTFPAANGCDSIHTIEILHLDTLFSTEEISICFGDSIDIFGSFESSSGIYSGQFQAQNGCDSSHQITLSVLDTSYSFIGLEICQGETIDIFGSPEFTSGLYESVFSNAAGCDSLVQVELLVLDTLSFTDSITICQGDTIDLWGMQVFDEGWYSQTSTATNGCDSAHYRFVGLSPNASTSETQYFCAGESADIFGVPTNQPGVYEEVYTAFNGCDSVHSIELIQLDTMWQQNSLTICSGDSILIFGSYESQSGFYQMTFSGSNGCDSTQVFELSVFDTLQTMENISICEGEEVDVFGNPTSVAGTYSEVFTSWQGCDSIHTIDLAVLQPVFTAEDLSICTGDSILIFGNWESTAGIYEDIFSASNGCDSTHTVNLMVNAAPMTFESLDICDGETIILFGQEVSSSGVYEGVFSTGNGCDSIHQVTVTEHQEPEISVDIIDACQGESDAGILVTPIAGTPPFDYIWSPAGPNQPELTDIPAGDYLLTVTDANGCSEFFYLQVEERPVPFYNILSESPDCKDEFGGMIWLENADDGLLFNFNGQGFEAETVFSGLSGGEYSLEIMDPAGCLFEEQITLETGFTGYVDLPDLYQIQLGESVVLSPSGALDSVATFSWSPTDYLTCTDCPFPEASPPETQDYELMVTFPDGCSLVLPTRVEVDRSLGIYIPNSFSPDYNGINDVFKPFGEYDLPLTVFRIFDRWGDLQYEETNTSLFSMQGWDGTSRGRKAQTGVYVYMAEIILPDGTSWVYKGDLLLMR